MKSYAAFVRHPFPGVSWDSFARLDVIFNVVAVDFHSWPYTFSSCGYHDHGFPVLLPSQKAHYDDKVSYHMLTILLALIIS